MSFSPRRRRLWGKQFFSIPFATLIMIIYFMQKKEPRSLVPKTHVQKFSSVLKFFSSILPRTNVATVDPCP